MLRTLGIPARLATGFQSGVYNPVTDLWLVRASDAHTWVEAWIPGHGWTTFDPTPPDPNIRGLGLAATLGLYLDAASTFWQEWVVGYDAGRQGALGDRIEQSARRLGIRWFDWLNGGDSGRLRIAGAFLRRFGSGILAGLGLCAAIWAFAPALIRKARMRQRVRLARRGQAAAGDATLLYQRMLDLLKRRGYHKPAWFTPAEFAASLPRAELGSIVGEFTLAYNAWRFGGRTEVAPRLSVLLEELERQPR
jgi:protein-glutamine gamma-glutamyltransferase